ncbi:hypothetical protein J6590_101331, partial [Homalodisca vitripennis]
MRKYPSTFFKQSARAERVRSPHKAGGQSKQRRPPSPGYSGLYPPALGINKL